MASVLGCQTELDSHTTIEEKSDCIIKFDSNGGTGSMASVTAAAGDIVQLKANTFSRSGYMFVNWNTAKNGHADAYDDASCVILSKDITLYAQWAEPKTLTFLANSGTGDDVIQTVPKGISTTLTLPSFSKEGYVLCGWNTEPDGSGTSYSLDKAATFSLDTALYAQWSIPRTIYFLPNGAEGSFYSQVVADGTDSYLLKNTFKNETYLFKNWNTSATGDGTAYKDGQVVNISEDLTLFAQWTRLYTVTYTANGGEGEDTKQQFYEGEPNALTENSFTREGYGFASWNTQSDGSGTPYSDGSDISVFADITLYAQWGKIQTITFNANSEEVTGTTQELTAAEGSTITLSKNGFARPGFIFVGWNTKPDGTGLSYGDKSTFVVGEYTTLYAQWIDESVASSSINIASIEHGTVTVGVTKALPGTTITVNVTPNEDYVLSSLNAVDSKGAVELTKVSETEYTFTVRESDITINAAFTLIEYTVTFEANKAGAEGETESITQTVHSTVALTQNGFEYDGYTVTHWNTAPDGNGTSYALTDSITIEQNITLYAQWIEGYGTTVENLSEILAAIKEKGHTQAKVVIFDATNSSLTGSSASNASSISKVLQESSVNVELVLDQNEDLTAIGNYAFAGCTNLSSITLPENITEFKTSAFTGCTNLTIMNFSGTFAKWCQINFANNEANPVYFTNHLFIKGAEIKGQVVIPEEASKLGTYVFAGAKEFTSVTANGIASSVGNGAFYGCTGLTSLSVNNSVKEFGTAVLFGCSSLQNLKVPFVKQLLGAFFGTTSFDGATQTTQYYESSKSYAYYIPDSLKTVTVTSGSIGYGTFYNCKNIESITLPDSLTAIGASAFYGCAALKAVTIPANVQTVGKTAFYGCSALVAANVKFSGTLANWAKISFETETANPLYYTKKLYVSTGLVSGAVTIPSGTTQIGSYAFINCTDFTKVTIPTTVTSIGNYAFKGCTSLTTMDLPLPAGSFLSLFGTEGSNVPSSIKTVTVRGGTIGEKAFSGCSNITNITLSFSPTAIGDNAFTKCSGLTSFTIPNTVTSIGQSAFSSCTGLSSITIPESVTSVGRSAFFQCVFTSLSFPPSTNFESGALWGLNNIESLTLPINNAYLRFGSLFATEQQGSYTYKVEQRSPYSNVTTTSTYWIPKSLTTVTINGGGTMAYAFDNCKYIQTIIVAPTGKFTGIAGGTFAGCTGVYKVEFSSACDKLYANSLQGLSGLTELTIPFVGYDGTESSASSNTVLGRLFGEYAYGESGYAAKATVQSYNGSEASEKTYYIPKFLDTVTVTGGSVYKYAFNNCTSIKTVTLTGVKSIEQYAFTGCSNITTVSLNGMTEIPQMLFSEYFTNLKTVTLGSTVKEIGLGSFTGCTSLSSLTLPSKLTKIGLGAFAGCTALTSVTLPTALDEISGMAFKGCTGLTSIVIPAKVTKIGYQAFNDCTNLTSAKFADTTSTWYHTTNLASFTDGSAYISVIKEKTLLSLWLTRATAANIAKMLNGTTTTLVDTSKESLYKQ